MEDMQKPPKIKRRLRPKQKTKLVKNGEFYCPYCQRKTKLTMVSFGTKKGAYVVVPLSGYSERGILVCDKCFTFLGFIP
jgi:hypothetical protein